MLFIKKKNLAGVRLEMESLVLVEIQTCRHQTMVNSPVFFWANGLQIRQAAGQH